MKARKAAGLPMTFMPAISKRPVTAATVARSAGVSITTVSFVLNGRAAEHGIAKETVKSVTEIARRLNYVPNGLARSLRHQHTKAIGVIFSHLKNDWAHRIMEGVYSVLDPAEYVPLIVSHREDAQREAREIDSFVARRVDGILCNPLRENLDPYRRLLKRGVPLTFFSDTFDSMPQVSFSAWDPDELGMAVRHLIESGSRRIAYLGLADNRRMAAARRQVFEKTLRQHGLAVEDKWVVHAPLSARYERVIAKLFASQDRPDGVFALYADIAVSVVDTLQSLGLRVPLDVQVAALGNGPMIGPHGYDITRVDAPVEREGEEAARALLGLIADPKIDPVHKLIRGGHLIPGKTTRLGRRRDEK